jgi:hydrogenase expression/formation protein HypE
MVDTGDTKVVPRGAADKIFINSSGIGEFTNRPVPGPQSLEVGDALIVTGPVGCHGMAVMAARESIDFEPAPRSDSAPLIDAVIALQQAQIPARAMRDATRGGLGAVLHEWSHASGKTLAIQERLVPVLPEVRGACELLGLDPIHVANEGTMLVAVPRDCVDRAIDVLRNVRETSASVCIGSVQDRGLAGVVVARGMGTQIPLDEPAGAPLPRIC